MTIFASLFSSRHGASAADSSGAMACAGSASAHSGGWSSLRGGRSTLRSASGKPGLRAPLMRRKPPVNAKRLAGASKHVVCIIEASPRMFREPNHSLSASSSPSGVDGA